MNRKSNPLKLYILLFFTLLLDYSIPAFGMTKYSFLTPVILLFVIINEKKDFNVLTLIPVLLTLDLLEGEVFFGFYTFYFSLSILFLNYIKRLVPNFLLAYIFYLVLWLLYYYLAFLSVNIKDILLITLGFTLIWAVVSKRESLFL